MTWLVDEEYSLVCDALAADCDTGGDRIMLRHAVGEEEANNVILSGTLLQRATTILDVCDGKATTAEMIKLLRFVKSRADVPAIIERLKAVRVAPVTPAPAAEPKRDPYYDRVIDADNLFLDRLHLREAVTKLIRDSGPVVLKVYGPKNSGKTYTSRLCFYLFLKQQPLYPTKVERGGFDMTAVALANTLVTRITNAPIRADELNRLEAETDERRGFFLAEKVLLAAASTKFRWWFILDDFDHSERTGQPEETGLPAPAPLRLDTRHFITQLAVQIAAHPPYRTRYRLILLNYRSPLPPQLDGLVVVDPLEPHTVDWNGEGTAYFTQVFPQLGLDPALMARIPPDAAAVLAADALASIGPRVPERIVGEVIAALLGMRQDLPDVLRDMAHV